MPQTSKELVASSPACGVTSVLRQTRQSGKGSEGVRSSEFCVLAKASCFPFVKQGEGDST